MLPVHEAAEPIVQHHEVLKWFAVFGLTFVADICWARYFLAAAAHRALASSLWSAGIAALGCITTVAYVDNHWLATATIAGAFLGTYYVVRSDK